MTRPLSCSVFAPLLAMLFWAGSSSTFADDASDIANIKQALQNLRKEISRDEAKLKNGLEPDPFTLKLLIGKLEREINITSEELKTAKPDQIDDLNAKLQGYADALRYYKTLRELQELDKNAATEGIGGILTRELQQSPYLKKHIDPIRKRIEEYKEKEQTLLTDLAKLEGGDTTPTGQNITGDIARYKFQDNKYMEAVGWRTDGDRAELTLIFSSEITKLPKEIRDHLGLKQQLVFPARKVGIEYHVDGKEYREFVTRLTKIFTPSFFAKLLGLIIADSISDEQEPSHLALDAVKEAESGTNIDIREARLVIVPVDDNLYLTSHMHAILTGTVDGKPSTEVIGLDETGKPKPWKFVLIPENNDSPPPMKK